MKNIICFFCVIVIVGWLLSPLPGLLLHSVFSGVLPLSQDLLEKSFIQTSIVSLPCEKDTPLWKTATKLISQVNEKTERTIENRWDDIPGAKIQAIYYPDGIKNLKPQTNKTVDNITGKNAGDVLKNIAKEYGCQVIYINGSTILFFLSEEEEEQFRNNHPSSDNSSNEKR